MINFKEFDFPGIVNGEEVDSIARWFEENEGFCGPMEIEIPQQQEELYRVCVKKEMTAHPVLSNLTPLPATQMVGKKISTFAGFYIMELWLEEDKAVRWRGKVPKHFILHLEQI